jgi:hypothetical protein
MTTKHMIEQSLGSQASDVALYRTDTGWSYTYEWHDLDGWPSHGHGRVFPSVQALRRHISQYLQEQK